MTHQQQQRGSHRPGLASRWWASSIAIIGAALVIGTAVALNIDNDAKSQEIETLRPVAEQAREFADGVIMLCASNTPEATEMRRLGFCREAVDVQAAAPVPILPEGVSRAEILDLVRDVYADHPPTVPVDDWLPEVDRLVRERYAENAPTPEQLLALVRQVYLEHPPPAGEQGEQGEPGAIGAQGEPGERGATGATGAQGPQGSSWVEVTYRVREDGGCDLVFSLFNPVDGTTRQHVVQLPIACTAAEPTTTAPPPVPTTTDDPLPLLPGG